MNSNDAEAARREFARRLGANIRRHRVRLDLSQAQLAQRIHVTQASLSNYEHGKRHLALVDVVELASALGLGLQELLADDWPAVS